MTIKSNMTRHARYLIQHKTTQKQNIKSHHMIQKQKLLTIYKMKNIIIIIYIFFFFYLKMYISIFEVGFYGFPLAVSSVGETAS